MTILAYYKVINYIANFLFYTLGCYYMISSMIIKFQLRLFSQVVGNDKHPNWKIDQTSISD